MKTPTMLLLAASFMRAMPTCLGGRSLCRILPLVALWAAGSFGQGRPWGGLPKDDSQAVSWYRKAAEAGDARGMVNLGVMYASRWGGLPKDDSQAVSWFRKAVEAGNALGMANLGFMYSEGRGGLPK